MYGNRYNNEAAAAYALKYAYTPNPQYPFFALHGDGGGDCSNFISQCLLAGGAPMARGSVSPWWYNSNKSDNKSDDRWSMSWAVAHSLYWCLKIRGISDIPGLKGMEISDKDKLTIGDIIQYENMSGKIYHSAIVTFISSSGPLITQHTINASNIPYIKSAAKIMHFIKIVVD